MNEAIEARELNGTHIDQVIRFQYRMGVSGVIAEITGLVREVHHVPSAAEVGKDVVVWLTSPDEEAQGAVGEFAVPADTLVVVLP